MLFIFKRELSKWRDAVSVCGKSWKKIRFMHIPMMGKAAVKCAGIGLRRTFL